MSQTADRPRATAAVRRNRLVATISTVGLGAVLAGLTAISDGSAQSVFGLVGMGGMVAGFGLFALDGWFPLRRPAPRLVPHLDGRAVCLRLSRVPTTMSLLLATGLNLMTGYFYLAPSVRSVAEGQRGGALVYVVLVVAPFGLVAAVCWMLRPDRVVLAPGGLVVRQLGRAHALAWDSVDQVTVVPDDAAMALRIGPAGGKSRSVPTRYLGLSGHELAAVLRHLAATPGDRALLSSASGPEGVRSWAGQGTRGAVETTSH